MGPFLARHVKSPQLIVDAPTSRKSLEATKVEDIAINELVRSASEGEPSNHGWITHEISVLISEAAANSLFEIIINCTKDPYVVQISIIVVDVKTCPSKYVDSVVFWVTDSHHIVCAAGCVTGGSNISET